MMIINYYGGTISKEYLKVLTNTTSKGVSALDLINGSKVLGLDGKGVTGDVLELNKDDLPCICHITNNNLNHFAVITSINYQNKVITLLDPDLGKRILSYNEFNNISSNNYLLFKVNKPLPIFTNNNVVCKSVIKILLNNTNILINIIILSLIYLVLNIVFIYRFKLVTDYVINYSSTTNILLISIVLSLTLIIKNIAELFRNKLLLYLKKILSITLITKTFQKILSLPYIYYHNKSSGEIITRLKETEDLSDIILNIILLILDIILLVASCISLYILSKYLFIMTLSIVLIMIIVGVVYNIFISNYILNVKIQGSLANTKIMESITGIETINNTNINNYITNTFTKTYLTYLNSCHKYASVLNTEEKIITFLTDITLLLVLIFGSNLVIKNELSLSSFITFDSILIYLLSPINSFINTSFKLKDFNLIKERINDIFSINKENIDNFPNDKLKGEIALKNVYFKYSDKILLNNITNKINIGDKVLLKGKSGCGKSTLLKIIAGNIKNYDGDVYLDKYNIKELANDYLKENILYVSQQEKIFNDSVYNNIVLNNIPTYDELLKAINTARVDFIKNNDFKNTYLEEDGFNISGGERNRLIIARSILKKANIYLFDETFNELDEITRTSILKDTFKLLKDKTIIVVSHYNLKTSLFTKVLDLGTINLS